MALFPGAVTSFLAYRRDLARIGDVPLLPMLAVSLLGGLIGAVLLLSTPDSAFRAVVPWLLLLASIAFAFARPAGAALRRFVHVGPVFVLVLQFLLAVYGGYFGGAVGIMMMAAWSLLSSAEIKSMNPAKCTAGGCDERGRGGLLHRRGRGVVARDAGHALRRRSGRLHRRAPLAPSPAASRALDRDGDFVRNDGGVLRRGGLTADSEHESRLKRSLEALALPLHGG